MMKYIKSGIAVLGVALLGIGLYGQDMLWAFGVGLLLVVLCAVSSKKMRDYVLSLLEWI
ncbi:hypothetical protein [Flavonifractor sp. AGMB03687]|uniref:hypothetical protein n=1 Tax=Flavonifractor sp. AGMB03687 TaxID=2785133 RepID=UPI001ADF3BEA|nr:hypothetical protein [Flavonifractor sp. AGMB03687]